MANDIEVIHRIYDAFGRGDVPAILAHLADDVQWEYGVNSTDVPWLQPRRGRQQVAQFFETLAGWQMHRFVPKTFLQADNLVVVLIDLEATVRATGMRIVEEDEVHIWHVRDGQVVRFRHRADTAQHLRAFRGQAS